MKKVFVKTGNYERFQGAIRAVEARGAPEAGWLLVVGDPARGKSTIVDKWAASSQVGAIYLRGKEQWTPSFFLAELAGQLKIDDSLRGKSRFQAVITRIGAEQMPVVIDEVQHAMRDNAAVLEVLRDITDLTETIAVLVAGVDDVMRRLARPSLKQIASRIAQVVEFAPNSQEDTALVCHQLADVEIAPDLVAEVHRQSRGLMRPICNAIAGIEAHASRNKLPKVKLADLAGQELCHDWQSRRPQLVKVAAGGR